MKCSFTNIEYEDPSDGVWDDGEWISWNYINSYIDDEEGWDADNAFSKQKPSPSTLQL